jgi:hypothetical protein
MVETIPALIERQAGNGRGLLIIPDRIGPVLAFRNGQAALVSPPLLVRSRLDEVVPSLMHHLQRHRAQFRPAWVACWVADRQQMEVIWTADGQAVDPDGWPGVIRDNTRRAGCEPI